MREFQCTASACVRHARNKRKMSGSSPGRRWRGRGLPSSVVAREEVVADDGYVGAGDAVSTPELVNAVATTARLEGILLDSER